MIDEIPITDVFPDATFTASAEKSTNLDVNGREHLEVSGDLKA